jgi:hypothetical protein
MKALLVKRAADIISKLATLGVFTNERFAAVAAVSYTAEQNRNLRPDVI